MYRQPPLPLVSLLLLARGWCPSFPLGTCSVPWARVRPPMHPLYFSLGHGTYPEGLYIPRMCAEYTQWLLAGYRMHQSCSPMFCICSVWYYRGDVPRVGLDYESFTSLRVSLQAPDAVQPYPIDRFLVQWSQSPTFNDSVLALPVSWAVVAGQAVNASFGVSLRVTLSSGTASTSMLATIRYLPEIPGVAGSVLVELGSPLPLDATFAVSIPGLLTSVAYFVRASCNNAMFRSADSIGPRALSTPAFLSPLSPLIDAVTIAVPTLPSAGGQAIVVRTCVCVSWFVLARQSLLVVFFPDALDYNHVAGVGPPSWSCW